MIIDPYFDENTGTLKNLLDARSPEELDAIEPQIVFANELELPTIGIPRTNDLVEILAIHKQLFKGVYDWAGAIRIVDIRKTGSNEYFLVVSKIKDAANYVFAELAKDNFLHGMAKHTFTTRLAHHYDQLNFIHPFREGNGRTQRIFWTRVANDAGYSIDWNEVKAAENDEASRVAAEDGDLSKLQAMFDKIVTAREQL